MLAALDSTTLHQPVLAVPDLETGGAPVDEGDLVVGLDPRGGGDFSMQKWHLARLEPRPDTFND